MPITCHKRESLSEKFVLLFSQSKLKYPKWPCKGTDTVDFIALMLPQKSVLSSTWGWCLTHMQVTGKFCSADFLSLIRFYFLVLNFVLLSQLHTTYVTLSIFSLFHRLVNACCVCPYTSLYRKWICNSWSRKSECFISWKVSGFQWQI